MGSSSSKVSESVVLGSASEPHNEESTTTVSTAVPVEFRWPHGGNELFVVGSFGNWQQKVPLQREGGDLITVIRLLPGNYEYKFVVDGEWKCSMDKPIRRDNLGNENNVIEVLPDDHSVSSAPFQATSGPAANSGPSTQAPAAASYSQAVDDDDEMEDYSKDPPTLPPHLKRVVLNCASFPTDATLLPVPQLVTVNHLYCAPRIEGITVLGITNRYNSKFSTTVFYTPAVFSP